jgi:hypothetical protein
MLSSCIVPLVEECVEHFQGEGFVLFGCSLRHLDSVPYISGISADDVSFSKDGQRVAYGTYPEGNQPVEKQARGTIRHKALPQHGAAADANGVK